MKTKANKTCVAIALMAMIFSSVQPVEAQGLLNKLKNKAKETLNQTMNGATKSEVKESTSKKAVDISDGKSSAVVAGNIPVGLENLHMGTTHSDIFGKDDSDQGPTVTSSTKYVSMNGAEFEFGPFYDGVAYINSFEDGRFYIDMNGNKLFKSRMDRNSSWQPRFNSGVVMEVGPVDSKDILSPTHAFILDKRGNVVKELNTRKASNFVDGVAIVIFQNKPEGPGKMPTWTLKYVDTKGNFVFPNLWFTTAYNCPIQDQMDGLIGKTVDGRRPYVFYDKEKGTKLWGFHDGKGNVVIKPKYLDVCYFSDGLAAVLYPPTDGGERAQPRWGYIDKDGREVIPPTYVVQPSDFDSGLARVLTRDKEAYIIDKTGKTVFGPVNRGERMSDTPNTPFYISPFCNGVALLGCRALNKGNNEVNGFYFSIDTKFNKLAYTYYYVPVVEMDNTGKYDIVTVSKEYNCFMLTINEGLVVADPRTLDRRSKYPAVEKTVRYADHSGNRGYINANGEYIIKFKKNEF